MPDNRTLVLRVWDLIETTPEQRAEMPPMKRRAVNLLDEIWRDMLVGEEA